MIFFSDAIKMGVEEGPGSSGTTTGETFSSQTGVLLSVVIATRLALGLRFPFDVLVLESFLFRARYASRSFPITNN